MSLKPGTLLGRYEVVEEVGHGGMATVYRARQESLHRDVAIKVLPDFFADDSQLRERFSREAATIARLRHPNIVTVFDFGEEDGIPYIVTEFVDGQTLQQQLSAPMPPADVVALLRPLASALDYAHEAGVLHRDVKPSNVLLTSQKTPILTDFGLSRMIGSLPPLTRTGLPIGTPEYMAPELASGGTATDAADRYALAVVAFEMLTGTLPYHSEAPLAILLAHINDPPPRISRLIPGLPYDLDAVFHKALEKEPERRYHSAVAFVNALESVTAAAATAGAEPQEASLPRAFAAVPAEPTTGDEPTASTWPKAVREELQAPAVILALAVSALSWAYVAILAPAAGGRLVGIVVGAAAAAAGAGFAAVRLPSRVRQLDAAMDEERLHERAEREQEELRHLDQSLDLGFHGAGSTEGKEVVRRLTAEYLQLTAAMRADPHLSLSTAQIPGLATETYRRGLSVLVDALELVTAAAVPGPERLQDEVQALEDEIAKLERGGATSERIALRRQALTSHRERLVMLQDLHIRVDQLFYQARQCEAALHRSRISLAALRAGGNSAASIDSATRALQRTMEQARAVQDEVRKLGY